ncbi:hypothetical protein [Francisella philomiragia]|uniref:Uncharacterized protein n=1 Tax=Francisella philomiragia TaxID=28110 RepID=A0ABS1GC73_9GAMM|nr:hypothetical protein [Francisella philomiragia]MBK2258736.1 hypothetical protein [Francisella philomiragia]MBK2302427.1 hypothetical protein [Francisella philomiragia]
MFGDNISFFVGIVRTPLVRYGGDFKHPKGRHILQVVYKEMLLQITRDYASLPDPRTLTMTEIRFFYEGLREELKQSTKPKKSS